MAVGVQQMGDRQVALCTRHSVDDLDIEARHPSKRKMTKNSVDRKQTDGYKYSACELWSKGRD